MGFLAKWVSDNRKKPRISCVSIFFHLLLRSKRLLPSIQPASDSTFARTLNLMSLHPLRLILKSIALKVINSGKGKAELPEVGKAKVGIVERHMERDL